MDDAREIVAQAHQRARHARADDRPPGQQPHRRPGARACRIPQALKELLGKTAKLEFKLVDLDRQSRRRRSSGQAPIGSQILPYPRTAAALIAVKRSRSSRATSSPTRKQTYDQNGQPDVTITFNGEGGRRFARVTQENVGKPFAIIVDNKVISAPNINEPILGGTAHDLGGSFTVESANAARHRAALGQAAGRAEGRRGIDRRARARRRFDPRGRARRRSSQSSR